MDDDSDTLIGGRAGRESQTHPLTLLLQLTPLAVGYPLRRVVSWFIFMNLFALFNLWLIVRAQVHNIIIYLFTSLPTGLSRPSLSKVLCIALFASGDQGNHVDCAATIFHPVQMVCILPYYILVHLFILCRIVIGKYKEGKYSIWGNYYIRWWLVEQVRKLTGRGIFKLSNWSLDWYYRLLGAKIGSGTTIDKYTPIAEYDLIGTVVSLLLMRIRM